MDHLLLSPLPCKERATERWTVGQGRNVLCAEACVGLQDLAGNRSFGGFGPSVIVYLNYVMLAIKRMTSEKDDTEMCVLSKANIDSSSFATKELSAEYWKSLCASLKWFSVFIWSDKDRFHTHRKKVNAITTGRTMCPELDSSLPEPVLFGN
ncbi:hypothetical protein NPIL_525311 [Nephila pilipes]|uniref:Uncharacterized protein n=1 Tax=Nephila pilipes TaxID=299642 RepID=A0A8X6NNT6_NEPPI|nr:hypothetical protein NPIL_525311 [Nephila pilipes]